MMYEEFKKNNIEINHQTIDLIPDKDGFLFEIEDKLYLFGRIGMLLALFPLLFFALAIFDFNIVILANSDYRGYILVYIGVPFIIIEMIKIIFYMYKKNYKTIKFYENYIVNNRGEKSFLKELVDGFFVTYNAPLNKINRLNTTTTLVIFLFSPLSLYIFSIMFLTRYLFGFYVGTNNLKFNAVVLVSYDNRGISVPLELVTKNDKEKIIEYLQKYLHINIDGLEKRLFLIPEEKNWNLASESRKQEILKEKLSIKENL